MCPVFPSRFLPSILLSDVCTHVLVRNKKNTSVNKKVDNFKNTFMKRLSWCLSLTLELFLLSITYYAGGKTRNVFFKPKMYIPTHPRILLNFIRFYQTSI